MEIKIKYHSKNPIELEMIDKGNWIDMRASKGYKFKKGDFALIDLGVSMQLPEGYEGHLAPRSSTFKKWGLIQTNGTGIVDTSYCSDKDVWMMPVYATRDTQIYEGDRVCQFRIMPVQSHIEFKKVDHLDNPERGGFGSTGVR